MTAEQLEVLPVTLSYTNWRGETADRAIIPKSVWFGSTDWHPEPQWLLTAFDVEKGEDRDFAMKDFSAPSLARRVIAAEKLVERLDEILYDSLAPLHSVHEALTAYREASK